MDDRPVWRRLGWWGWLLILTGVLGVLTVVGALWLNSDGDLSRETARAKALGLATNWEELGLPRRTNDDPLKLLQLETIMASAKMESADGSYLPVPYSAFTPVSAQLAAWDSGVDAKIDAVIDSLTGNPCFAVDPDVVRRALAAGDAGSVISAISPNDLRYPIRSFLRYRSAQGQVDPQRFSDRLIRLIHTPTTAGISGLQISEDLIKTWMIHVLRNHTRLDAQAIATTALELADRMDADLLLAVRYEAMVWATCFRLPLDPLLQEWSIRLPAIMMNDLFREISYRSGRGAILGRYINAAAWVSTHGLPRSCAQILTACPSPQARTWVNIPSYMLENTLETITWECLGHHHPFQTRLQYQMGDHLRLITGLRLLAADLVGSAWPTDPNDPSGGRIRPILRDGQLIGGYSFGPDGLDNGGKNDGHASSDWCWELRATLGSPKAADPHTP